LFNSLPNIETPDEPLKPIKGLMPDPSDLPGGCMFHPRCNYASALCATRKPVATYLNESHFVECLAYEEGTGVTVHIEEVDR
jgi:peptide/nickel transport system ATP-binding protein